MTLNLWGRNEPLDRRMEALIDHLADDRPEVLALQEVESWQGESQATQLAEALGYDTVDEISTGRWGWRGEGLAILTDLEALPLEPVGLPHGWDAHPRALQQVAVTVERPDTGSGRPGSTREARIANTHLAYHLQETELRETQARRIREELTVWDGPAVLTGDLNDTPGSAPLRVLTEPHPAGTEGADTGGDGSGVGRPFLPLVDCHRAVGRAERWTFDPDNPYADHEELLRRRVDHVLARGMTITDARIVMDGDDGPVVSDHYGVRASLRPE